MKLALPTGSLQQPTLEMFAAADLAITTPNSRCYEASIEDPRVSCVRWLRPQEIPVYVADGLFDLGIAGYDWV
ncbi:MAG: ATP phosphoribosyltransferase, partial [Clostridia bacterium]|nr:ATP phosphoribosyltransferase [Clostridia bacterium]